MLVYLPSKLLPALTSIVTIPIYSRIFDPIEYGALSLAMTVVLFGGVVTSNWLTSSTLRFLPYYRKQARLKVFYSSLCASIVLSLFWLSLAMLVYGDFVLAGENEQFHSLLPWVVVLIASSSIFSILQTILRAEQRSKVFALSELYQVYCSLASGLIFVLILRAGAAGILWGAIVGSSSAAIGIIIWLALHETRVSPSAISLQTIADFGRYGLVGTIATIGTWVLNVSDRYVIESCIGTSAVGVYSMGYSIADRSIGLLVGSLSMAVTPTLVNSWELSGRNSTALLLGSFTRLATLLLVPAVLGIGVLAKPLMAVFTTDAYIRGSSVLFWAALGGAIYGFSLLAYSGLILEKKMGVMARNYLIAAAVNVLMNLLLVPTHGFIAAGINTAISYAVLLGLNIISARRYLPWFFPWRTLVKALFSGAVMMIGVYQFSHQQEPDIFVLLKSVGLGACLYLFILVLVGEIRKSEWNGLTRFVRMRD